MYSLSSCDESTCTWNCILLSLLFFILLQHNFTGMQMRGGSASKRRSKHKKEAKGRLNDGRSTHFVVGYTPFDFSSETQMKFRGESKTDGQIPPAGRLKPKGSNKIQSWFYSNDNYTCL